MQSLTIRTHVDSENLHLPELRPMIGKDVEMMIREMNNDRHSGLGPFFAIAGDIELDIEAVNQLREKSLI